MPERTKNIHTYLSEQGLLKDMDQLHLGDLTPEILSFLENEILPLGHSQDYITDLKKQCENIPVGTSIGDIEKDVYISKETYDGAMLALLSAVRGVENVLEEDSKSNKGYCITRPPGHHAKCNEPAGFCFFNNVALATKHAQTKGITKILIFDWDIHHGDGTQQAFYDDDSVLFISLHRCDNLTFYPYNESMKPTFTGKNGTNINVAWETGLVVDEEARENNT